MLCVCVGEEGRERKVMALFASTNSDDQYGVLCAFIDDDDFVRG